MQDCSISSANTLQILSMLFSRAVPIRSPVQLIKVHATMSQRRSFLQSHAAFQGLGEGMASIILTHWGQDKMATVLQMMFSNAFSWMKACDFHLKFHWSLFLRFQLKICQHWFRYWLGADQATSHYLNQWWLVYWRIYAPLGLNQLMGWCTKDITPVR